MDHEWEEDLIKFATGFGDFRPTAKQLIIPHVD